MGYLIADLFSGLLHWSLDNYGGRSTPVFGAIIDSFQGHHGEAEGGGQWELTEFVFTLSFVYFYFCFRATFHKPKWGGRNTTNLFRIFPDHFSG